ncbi:MAG TPA: hypothetical protein VJ754_00865, partial [Anaerolineae bacterium]|nr:hypothetical protein [Anaerolineae bacterium]
MAALIGLACLALASLAALIAQADPLPPPHLGYGLNSWGRPDLAEGLGFDWIKLFEEAGPPPATRLPYQVLYRVFVDGYPSSPAPFQQHIRDLVRAGRGTVEAYEIGNEVNLTGDGFWGQHGVDPEAYARLMCEIYPIIKNEDPNAIVVSAGLAPVGRVTSEAWHYVMDERIYAQRMLAQMKVLNAGRFCLDALGYHPHGFKVPPETDYRVVENGFAFRGAEIMHEIMVEAGAINMPVWATEFGWIRDPSSDPWTDGSGNPSSYGWCRSKRGTDIEGFLWMLVTEQEQADYLARAFQYADANWPWMGPMFVWNLDMYPRGWACSPHRFYSLFHANDDPNVHSPALAYSTLRSMPKRYANSNSPTLSVRPNAVTFAA